MRPVKDSTNTVQHVRSFPLSMAIYKYNETQRLISHKRIRWLLWVLISATLTKHQSDTFYYSPSKRLETGR